MCKPAGVHQTTAPPSRMQLDCCLHHPPAHCCLYHPAAHCASPCHALPTLPHRTLPACLLLHRWRHWPTVRASAEAPSLCPSCTWG